MTNEPINFMHQVFLLVSDKLIHTFIFLVIFDILTGIAKSFIGKATVSSRGLFGIVKHILIVMLCSFAYPYLQLLHFGLAARSFLSFFITMYAISIIENLSILGIPIPKFIKDHLLKLHSLSDDNQIK